MKLKQIFQRCEDAYDDRLAAHRPHGGALPIIPSAYASPIETGPLPATAIDEAFSKARETIARLESQNSIATLWRPSDSF